VLRDKIFILNLNLFIAPDSEAFMRFIFPFFGLVALCAIGCSNNRDEYIIYRTVSDQTIKPVIAIKTNYVVHRDVPDKPDITVIPRKYYDPLDHRLCTVLERHLIEMGIAVINAPPEHEETVTHAQNARSSEFTTNGSNSKSNGDSIEIRFSSVRDIKSTFAIIADGSISEIRVLRMDNQQLVALVDYRVDHRTGEDSRDNTGSEPAGLQSFRALIEALGFKPKPPAKKNSSPP
jgi:hypothetical protein